MPRPYWIRSKIKAARLPRARFSRQRSGRPEAGTVVAVWFIVITWLLPDAAATTQAGRPKAELATTRATTLLRRPTGGASLRSRRRRSGRPRRPRRSRPAPGTWPAGDALGRRPALRPPAVPAPAAAGRPAGPRGRRGPWPAGRARSGHQARPRRAGPPGNADRARSRPRRGRRRTP